MASKGRVGVLIETHFDEAECRRIDEVLPADGYEVEYLSYLWNQPRLTFKGNDFTRDVTVTTDVSQVDPTDYQGIVLIGGYAMDRLRYEEHPRPGQPNRAPAVEFLRKAVQAMDRGQVIIGTICHSLWLFCADPTLMKGRKVTCAHNIIGDVLNAGGEVIFDDDQAADTWVDGGLVTGRHPGVVDQFLRVFLAAMDRRSAAAA